MKKLNEKEEQIMQIIWRMERAFVKDILDALEEPRPPVTTVSSIVRKLESEGWLGYESFGKTHRYFPLVQKEDYLKASFQHLLQDYFEGSPRQLLSFFVEEQQPDPEEIARLLEEIKRKKG
jgi:predicted transcriptional regulator